MSEDHEIAVPLSAEDLKMVQEWYGSPRALTWDRDCYFQAVVETCEALIQRERKLIEACQNALGNLKNSEGIVDCRQNVPDYMKDECYCVFCVVGYAKNWLEQALKDSQQTPDRALELYREGE